MNEIEEMFYDALREFFSDPDDYLGDSVLINHIWKYKVRSQVPIGIYLVDFLIDDRFVIEIDGHEYHKTKEQRHKDCVKERFLLSEEFVIIRFTGSEVFVDPMRCALAAINIIATNYRRDEYIEVDFIRRMEDKGYIKLEAKK